MHNIGFLRQICTSSVPSYHPPGVINLFACCPGTSWSQRPAEIQHCTSSRKRRTRSNTVTSLSGRSQWRPLWAKEVMSRWRCDTTNSVGSSCTFLFIFDGLCSNICILHLTAGWVHFSGDPSKSVFHASGVFMLWRLVTSKTWESTAEQQLF